MLRITTTPITPDLKRAIQVLAGQVALIHILTVIRPLAIKAQAEREGRAA